MSLRTFKRQLILSLSVLALLLSLNGWAAEDRPTPSCGQRIVQYLMDRLTFKDTRVRTKEMIAFQKDYWKEVKESKGKRLLTTAKNSPPSKYATELFEHCKKAQSVHGCIGNVLKRMVVIEREHPDDLRWKELLFSPGAWAHAPFSLPVELLQDRYHLSSPSKLILSLPLLMAATITYDEYLDSKFEEALKADVVPGLEYLRELGHIGLLEPGLIGGQVGLDSTRFVTYYAYKHVQNLKKWRESQGDPKYLIRLEQLKELGLLRDDAEVRELSREAFRVYVTERNKREAKLATRVEKAWQEKLNKDPNFAKYSPEVRQLLGMVFAVPFKVLGHSDYELLARSAGLKVKGGGSSDPLNGLSALSRETDRSTLLRMASETLEHPEEAQKKQELWGKNHPNEDHPFLHRADLLSVETWGEVSFDQDGKGKDPTVLKEELSYWELAWKDPRFADIKAAYDKGESGEMDAIGYIFQRVGSLNDIYAASRAGAKPDVAKLCAWAGESEKEPPNVLISGPVSHYLDLIRKPRKLSYEEEEGCRVDVAEFVYNSYISGLKSGQGATTSMSRDEFVAGMNRVLSFCPVQSPPRACP